MMSPAVVVTEMMTAMGRGRRSAYAGGSGYLGRRIGRVGFSGGTFTCILSAGVGRVSRPSVGTPINVFAVRAAIRTVLAPGCGGGRWRRLGVNQRLDSGAGNQRRVGGGRVASG